MKASSRSVYSSCSNHDPLDPWGPIRVSNLFIRMYMYIIILLFLKWGIWSVGLLFIYSVFVNFFLNQALFSVRLEMFIDFTLIIERKQLLDVDWNISYLDLIAKFLVFIFHARISAIFPLHFIFFFFGGGCSVPKFCKTYCWFWIKTITRFYI